MHPRFDDLPTPLSTKIGCVVMLLLFLAVIGLAGLIATGRLPSQ